MIQGVHHEIAAVERHISFLRKQTKKMASPREQHDYDVALDDSEKKLATLTAHAQANLKAIGMIEETIHYLEQSPHQTADRTLAKRHLEDASMRLRRELGDQ